MTEIRKHIVDDMAKHIAKDLVDSFGRHFRQLHAAGVNHTEASEIAAVVARHMLVSCLGGAVIMTGNSDRKMAFAMLLGQIVDNVNASEGMIQSNLQEAVDTALSRFSEAQRA